MIEKVIIAGAGGQGIMLMGKILALAGLKEDRHVSWIPSYGAEVRGGAAYCMVTISDREIPSPFIENADTLIIMNELSLARFKGRIDNKGLIIINRSLVRNLTSFAVKRHSKIQKLEGPFTDIASKLGNIKVANVVALGFYLTKKKVVDIKNILRVIREIAPEDKKDLIEINKQALFAGMDLIKRSL